MPPAARIALVTPILGQAASSPIRPLDAEGNELAAGGALTGSYNQDSFETRREFSAPTGVDLELVLEKTAIEGSTAAHGIQNSPGGREVTSAPHSTGRGGSRIGSPGPGLESEITWPLPWQSAASKPGGSW